MSVPPELLHAEAARLTREFFEVTNFLGLSNREIGEILGVSEATISRAKKRERYFAQNRHQQWRSAELMIRAARELQRIYDHPRKEKHWFTTYNSDLCAMPITLLHSMEGLIEVVRHLESRQLP
jgi:IS30 family transposase